VSEKIIKQKIFSVLALLCLALIVWLPDLFADDLWSPVCDPDLLCVVFMDVGQGDAIFIQSPSGKQLLVDGGRDNSVLRHLGEILSFSDRDIDYMLITHPDSDHINGLSEVLDRYDIHHIIYTENNNDTDIWRLIKKKIATEGSDNHFARRGQRYDLGTDVYLDILLPDVDVSDYESNSSSIVARLVYGQNSVMLTGDSPKAIEEYLVLIEGDNLASDILKVGHHGSRTSTSELFLSEVDPLYAVISAGRNNSYGHPHVEVTDLLFNYGVTTLSTIEEGNIVFYLDGLNAPQLQNAK